MENKKLETYLADLEKALAPISVPKKAEIITEIKSHVLEALSKSNQSTSDILSRLGKPEQVANKYLLERGLELQRPPRHSIVKWLVIGFLGTFSILLLSAFVLIWKFTPFIKVDEETGRVQLMGGLIDIHESNGILKIGGTVNSRDHFNDQVSGKKENAAIKEFDLTKGQLILENGSGKIQILGKNQNKVKVEYKKLKWGKNCNLILKQSGTTAYVKVNKKRFWSTGDECRVDFNVTIPKNLFTSIKSGSGDLSLHSISGDLDFKTGSGDVAGQEISSPKVSGLSGSGDINLKGTFLDADIKTGSGEISAHFKKTKRLSKFFAKSGSGDISIMVPKNSTVEVNFKSGSGVLKNKTSYSDNPNLKVNVRTGSGDLKIESIERNQNRI